MPVMTADGFDLPAYNAARPFASFLPGIAGAYGKPLWVFYTNRGQCIASFGVRDRNGAMLEFYPADKAYALTSLFGFRTFFKQAGECYEPFQSAVATLTIRPEEIEIVETHADLRIRVTYFGLPNEAVPALVRRVTVENAGAAPQAFEVLDGLPLVVPFGLEEHLLKQMSRTLQAFAEITHVAQQLPFYKLKVKPSDKPEMERIDGGFFAFTMQCNQPVDVLVDPEQVFGSDTSLRQPLAFMQNTTIDAAAGRQETLTGCAFAKLSLQLEAGETASWDSYFGQTPDWQTACAFRERITGNYALQKRAENRALLNALSGQFDLVAGPPQLAPYTRQAFLDNTLRGGQPVVIEAAAGSCVFHMYTRKHGDMERDYNFFDVAPSFYSQGNSNFRDVNQNRRSENYLFKGIDTANIVTFFNLLQIDGNNPLIVHSEKFCVPPARRSALQNTPAADWLTFLSRPFSPGELLQALLEAVGTLERAQPLFRQILGVADLIQEGRHGEGYWVDHWLYNLDLLDSYAGLYPDRLQALLVGRGDYTYFDSEYLVQPRARKYTLRSDGKVRQLHAVLKDEEKLRLLNRRSEGRNMLRTLHGAGPVLQTTLLAKLINLLAVKTALLDPFGIGLEMETDKPGWCDALNGLPGLFGSSTHEAYALRRGLAFVGRMLAGLPELALAVPLEVADFVRQLTVILCSADSSNFFPSWEKLATLREDFRESVRLGVAGELSCLSCEELQSFVQAADILLQRGLKKAVALNGLPVSYYTHQVEAYEVLPAPPKHEQDEVAVVHVKVTCFSQKPVSNFLEGAVHALRGAENPDSAAALYRAVRQSALYDKKLGMYRVNCPLDEESFEIGRSRIFSPGWLENESIFLHMHYKFLLETLRSGLAQPFFDDLQRGLVAFQSADVYGRSPLENSSFIASSRFPDASVHGVGFVARLSGATAEWLSMVLHMGLGGAPFRLVEGSLRFEPHPTLDKWLFTTVAGDGCDAHSFAFKLFGQTWIVYQNPARCATFGPGAVTPARFDLHYLDGSLKTHHGSWLPAALALSLRDYQLSRLVIHLA